MAVKTELVKEFLIDRVFGEVEERHPGKLPDRVEAALARAPDAVLPLDARSPEADTAAVQLARRGYLTRVVETELFERARQLHQLGDTDGPVKGDWVEAAVRVSAKLARMEPAGKPDPRHDGWTSWRVPGPGGHIRHYLALMSAFTLFSDGEDSPPSFPDRIAEDDLKRGWMYGFYLRCFEESDADDPAA